MYRFRNNPHGSRLRDCGFTLLEVVVAFSILAVSLGVTFYAFGTGASNASLSERYTVATLHAESLLAATGIESPLVQSITEGKPSSGYRWRRTVSLVGGLDTDSVRAQDAQLYEVVLEVFWEETGKTRSVLLRTQRLGVGS